MSTKSSVAPIEIELPEVAFRLQRCDDFVFNRAASVSHPIRIDEVAWWSLSKNVVMPLPQLFAAITSLIGPSGELFDPWKGAFGFPFKLTVRRGGNQYRYLVLFVNYRTSINHYLYRVLNAGEAYPQDQTHAPFEDEMSQKEFFDMLLRVYSHLDKYFRQMPKWSIGFVREVPAIGLLFGFNPETEEFFQQCYRDGDQYTKALAKWREIIPNNLIGDQVVDLDWLPRCPCAPICHFFW